MPQNSNFLLSQETTGTEKTIIPCTQSITSMLQAHKDSPIQSDGSKDVCQIYRDFSHVAADTPIEDIDYEGTYSGATMPGGTRGTDSNFPAKLHHILSQPNLAHIITWMPHGRSWRLVDREAFLNKVMPNYFSHSNYASFARQVNGWGFKRVCRKGSDYGSYYHELFLRGMPHVAKRMRRPLKLGKKSHSDPENEPDFEALSRKHPLPEVSQSQGLHAGFSLINNKAQNVSKVGSSHQIKNFAKNCGLMENICNVPSTISGMTNLMVGSSGLSHTSLFQSLYHGLQPQDDSFQSFLNQYARNTLLQDTSNHMPISNMSQYNHVLGENLLNPLGTQNMASYGNNYQDIQLAMLQQRLRQSHSNASIQNCFPVNPADIVNDLSAAQSYNYRTALGLSPKKQTRLNGSKPSGLVSSAEGPYMSSISCFVANTDNDERSMSSDFS